MQKKCLCCGNQYTKKSNCSLKAWSIREYCSIRCSKIGKPAWNKGIKGSIKLNSGSFKKGQSSWSKGLKMTEERKEKQRVSSRKYWDSPKGIEMREKIKQSQLGVPTGRIGSKCNFWKGGKTDEYHKLKNSLEWKTWRRKVFERDDYTCQDCKIRNHKGLGKTVQMHPHHIKLQSKYPKLRFEVSNGITLCNDCHNIRHTNL